MSRWAVKTGLLGVGFFIAFCCNAQEQSSVEKAREALTKQDEDADSAKQLEEVFQAAEKSYSLLKQGKMSLNYSFDYSYFGDQRLVIEIQNGSPRNFDVTPSAQHTFTNSFTFDYGLLDNLTVSSRVPLVAKYDSQDELSATEFGDISFTGRWQPFSYVPGKPSYTIFTTFKSKTGVSPYEIDVGRQLSTGSGYYSFSLGGSFSKVLDPVVVFSSLSYTHPLKETGLNQVRGGAVLTGVDSGPSISFSAGFSYSLSYDVSLSISTQLGYTSESTIYFQSGPDTKVQDQLSSLMNFTLGLRVSETKIINTSMGFGLTEDSPDVSFGVSLPINISGLKEE